MTSPRNSQDLNNFFEPCTTENVVVCLVDLVALDVHARVHRLIIIELLHIDVSLDVAHVLAFARQGKFVCSLLVDIVLNRLVCAL